MSTLANHILKTHFGYDSFRGAQEEIISNVMSLSDTLVIMPTGGGKSICYQVPALMLDGTAIVISPLIALMQDQVDALKANGIPAAALNSNTTNEEANEIITTLGTEDLKLLYVSPERAVKDSFKNLVAGKAISLIAIDEAHCVSIWGNDFRKEYTMLPKLTRHFPLVPVVALTATADKATQNEIMEKLELKNPQRYISSFERKNLTISVKPAIRRMEQIIKFVKRRKDESGIIYCLSRKSTEMVAEKLRNEGIRAFHYHAELSNEERNGVQKAFQQDEIKVVCATIAFGMGIDKSNVRYVLHYNLPKNLESYYQEIGRAGRDGLPAETVLYYSINDSRIFKDFIDQSDAGEDFKNVQLAKLDRMIKFCTSTTCRTNMILSYFGEHRLEPCGHCDNCKNPAIQFDGTVIAQKAFSALRRLNEHVGSNMLVDVLRGSRRKEIIEAGHDNIKTFGVGSDISRDEWLYYVSQLIDMGYLEIDFVHHNTLKLTSLAEDVLFKDQKVKLTKVNLATAEKADHLTMPKHSSLFERLRQVRMTLAKMEDVPAYIIFNDKTLNEMAEVKPLTLADMTTISGVGKHKLNKYGQVFIDQIQEFLKKSAPTEDLNEVQKETLELYENDLSPEEIASKRAISLDKVYSHLIYLYKKGNIQDVRPFVDEEEINKVSAAWYKTKKSTNAREVADALKENMAYHKVKFALAFLSGE